MKKKYTFEDQTDVIASNAMEALCIYNAARVESGKDILIRNRIKSEKSGRTFLIEITAKEV